MITISQDLIILHGGSGVARGGSFYLERGGNEKKEVKVPTTATLTKPLLPGLPSGRSRGHSPTSKQARTRVWSNSRPTCRRGGQSVPTAEEDRTPATGEDRACLLPRRTERLPPGRTECLLPRRSECACRRAGQLMCACRREGQRAPAAGEDKEYLPPGWTECTCRRRGLNVPAAREGS